MSGFSDAIVSALQTKIKCKGATGITKYIAETLRGNAGAYCRPKLGSKTLSGPRGIRRGRILDAHFQRYVKTKLPHPALTNVIKVLRTLDVTMVSSQVTVADPTLNRPHGLKTQLDGVGVIAKTRTVVIVELKSTQHTLREHRELYKRPCVRYGLMRNNLPNSEYTSHCLQTAFGNKAFKTNFKLPYLTQGLIIVNCSDNKAAYYFVPGKYENSEHFLASTQALLVRPQYQLKQTAAVVDPSCPMLKKAIYANLGAAIKLKVSKDKRVGKCKRKNKTHVFGVSRTNAAADVKAARARVLLPKGRNVVRGVFIPRNKTYVYKQI